MPTLSGSSCPRCALPSPRHQVCGRCLRHPPHFDATLALWRYAPPADRLILALKYAARLPLAARFADSLSALVLANASGSRPIDLIVPMPLHPKRIAERGFNQAGEIARRLGRLLDLPVDHHAIARGRNTVPQTGLALGRRRANLRGAFECPARDHANTVAGKRVAVVDDVMTSGATLNELAGTLRRAGATYVSNWVVARTWPRE